MKFVSLALAIMLPVASLAGADTRHGLEKRDTYAYTEVDGLAYRHCPNTACDLMGRLDAGTALYLYCYTRTGTTEVDGDYGWAQISQPANLANYWVALANGNYVTWSSDLPAC